MFEINNSPGGWGDQQRVYAKCPGFVTCLPTDIQHLPRQNNLTIIQTGNTYQYHSSLCQPSSPVQTD